MTEISVAVGDLARFCHRSGDIDHRFSPSPSGPEGIAGHQRLYARRPASYQSEYGVEHVHHTAGLVLTLRGRADGYDAEQGLLEEIKTCRVSPDSIPEPVAQLHFAQGRLYAAIIAARDALSHLDVRVTWLDIDSDQEHSRTERYAGEELAEFLHATLSDFTRWLQALSSLRKHRDSSLARLDFPYGGFRSGQREIAELTYKCIDQGGQMLLEAPTGIGKTAAVLFPALKALATGKHDRLEMPSQPRQHTSFRWLAWVPAFAGMTKWVCGLFERESMILCYSRTLVDVYLPSADQFMASRP